MHKTLAIICGVLVAGMAYAELDSVEFTWSNIGTNNRPRVTNTTSRALNAYVEGVAIDFSGYASPTATVTITTVASGGQGPAQTIFSKSCTADAYYAVRQAAAWNTGASMGNTNAIVKIPICESKVQFVVHTAGKTGVNARVWLIMDK